jgi:hypothetical protein
MDGSVPDIRRQLAGLLAGTVDLYEFQRWFATASIAVELHGTDADVDLSNRVENLLAEYTGDHINERQLLDALREETAHLIPAPAATATG